MNGAGCNLQDAVYLLAVAATPWLSANDLAEFDPARRRGWHKHQIAAALRHAERAGFVRSDVIDAGEHKRRRLIWRLTGDGRLLARLLERREDHRLAGAILVARREAAK